jgi:hypothetical protein
MPITPEIPYPKKSGHTVRSDDWNQAVDEIIRLDGAKVDREGDTITGALSVEGETSINAALKVGTPAANADTTLNGALTVTGNIRTQGSLSGQLPDDSVDTKHLRPGAVTEHAITTTAKLIARAVGRVQANGTFERSHNIEYVMKRIPFEPGEPTDRGSYTIYFTKPVPSPVALITTHRAGFATLVQNEASHVDILILNPNRTLLESGFDFAIF